ncbi:hypothetical protein SQ56_22980 [Klebsiella variicola]|nr:hypothetical protein SQ56_22980 [Klebsiella variicola]
MFHWFGGASVILRAAENIDGIYFGAGEVRHEYYIQSIK